MIGSCTLLVDELWQRDGSIIDKDHESFHQDCSYLSHCNLSLTTMLAFKPTAISCLNLMNVSPSSGYPLILGGRQRNYLRNSRLLASVQGPSDQSNNKQNMYVQYMSCIHIYIYVTYILLKCYIYVLCSEINARQDVAHHLVDPPTVAATIRC